ncbi:MAG: amino acid adenylation domain-containing protein [candidate division KSB1 bacterium]|nr:amino acid adenylation domain-containing protein [candidate division KSB1 bacterium]MDZ7276575.1 amino acid adenylation domain-containing protein [candidate division KSB1 bacterium]MDZ7288252.1 amino acid adenylation domain-containing protein [candidate division KSB1 bacterium]MDZ7300357.1 amino acid adenylation domain-containing protein [candidate division KSB1 bacterium]MDZ7307317.1 amino acid adenylation domain-containing protein [candidate division KSB1 bacterium]
MTTFDRKNLEDFYPLSPMQQGMLFHSLYAPHSGVYVEQLCCTLRGRLQPEAFERAWQRVIARHAILRTSFLSENLKEPVQVVHRTLPLPLRREDWSALSPVEQEQRLEDLLQRERLQGFDLSRGPLLRLVLLRTAPDTHRFVWTYHHLLLDGWSLPLLLQEVLLCYEAFVRGQEPQLPRPLPFRDYIVWLRRQDMAAAENFWRRQLAGWHAPTPLPLHRRPYHTNGAEATAARQQEIRLSRELTAALQTFARRQQVTLNTLVQGAWALLLSHYTGEHDVLFGATVSGRPAELPGAEKMIGLFINTLPVRVQIDPRQSLPAWLQALQRQQAELRQYEYSPLVQIQGWSAVSRGTPLFEHIFVFENFPVAEVAPAAGGNGSLRIAEVRTAEQTNYPLTVVAGPADELLLRLVYDGRSYDAAAIRQLLDHFANLLRGFVARPEQKLAQVPLLGGAERRRLLVDWNATQAAFPAHLCLHQLFEAQVQKTPDSPALIMQGRRLSYHELDERANQLAHFLQKLGVGPETIVAISVERSREMVIGLLGVLKAGGAYLPMDPVYPEERLAFMLADAAAPVALTQSHLREKFTAHRGQLVCLDTEWETIARESTQRPVCRATAANLAYVIYTSGSTGRPKGVMLEHRGAVNMVQALGKAFGIDADSSTLQFASFSFDASVEEVFVTLAHGACLHLVPQETVFSPPALLEVLRAQKISAVTLPPSLLAMLPETPLPALRSLVSAGESCPREIAVRWAAGRRFINGYGPTECTVCATTFRVEQIPTTTTVPIGRPIDNVEIYVLDHLLRPVPVGVEGEIYIGGVGVSRGYLNRPDLTAEKFLPDPFSNRPGARLYKSGDLARYLPDGNLEFLGRLDQQVKLRGFRIELGEIETRLREHPAVRAAAVVVHGDSPKEQQLVAYVVLDPPTAADAAQGTPAPPGEGAPATHAVLPELRAFLQQRLPAHMVPSFFVPLAAMPLTPNGKVDRRALPAPAAAHESSYVAPRTPEEEILAGIWAQVLNVPRVGVHDNFFELGGHSLLVTQLLSRVREALQVELPLRSLFDAPTIAGLAQQLQQARLTAQGLQAPPLTPVSREGDLPLSFAQQRLWFLDQLEPNNPFYNIPSAVRLEGALDPAILEKCLTAIIARHEILRTRIVTEEGRPRQVITPALQWSLPVIDLSGLPATEREAEVMRLARAEAQQPFALAEGPLFRVKLIRLAQEDHVALFTMHHIISDGWSMGVLLREVALLYDAFRNDRPSPLPPLPVQYADFAAWQRQWLQGEILERQLAYWKQQLAGCPPLLELPTDRPRPAVHSFRGAQLNFMLPADLTGRVKELSRQMGTTLFMTLLAAFQVLLARYSNQKDICVGTPIANRNRAELEGLIGFFANTIVLRTQLADNPSVRELLRRVRETALAAYAHQDVPFEMLVEALAPERDLSHTPLFQTMFVFQQQAVAGRQVPGLRMSPLEVHSGTAKFDLSLEMTETSEGLAATFEYNTDLFDAATIARLARHLERLLQGMAGDPDRRVAHLPLLIPEEQQQIVNDWNATAVTWPPAQNIQQLFEQQAAKTPEAVAVQFEDERCSYGELNRCANQLAHYLRSLGVGPEVLVAVSLPRSLEMVIALLAVLKAGGAYLPLDPAYPRERLAFMLQDAQPRVVLTTSGLRPMLPGDGLTVVELDCVRPLLARHAADNPGVTVLPQHPAYMIYTSGSTGVPKGAIIEQRGLINLVRAQIGEFAIRPESRVLQFAPFSFDASVSEIFTALISGATLCLIKPETLLAPDTLLAALRAQAISVVTLPPSLLAVLPAEALPALHTLVSAGENCSREIAARWAPGRRFINAYGPTENTVCASCHRVEKLPEQAGIPIGRPIANVQLYILDEHLQPVPVGVAGELYIGGVSLARGYHRRPDLTAEKFIPNPFSTEPGSRLYRSGDWARWLPDGTIEFLGRLDQQVKVRGFRIELGEIETVLAQHPGLREVAVVAREARAGERQLVAYVAPRAESAPASAELREFLGSRLPEYMIPALFVTLPSLPVTPSGKIDRRALPAPSFERDESNAGYVAPRTASEEKLVEIWESLLGVKPIGVHDNFFELGGDSIVSIQMIARASQAGIQLTPKLLFQHPTIAGLAAVAGTSTTAVAEQGLVTGPVPLTPIQHWFFSRHDTALHHWNTSIMLAMAQPLDPAMLAQTVQLLLTHHDALRLRFQRTAAGWRQYLAGLEGETPFVHVDLSQTPARRRKEAIESTAAQMQTSLNLAEGPLLRVCYMDLGPKQSHRLLLILHHLVVDGVSLRLFLEDLLRVYRQLQAGQPVSLPPKTTSFQAWARALVQYAQSTELKQELAHWREVAAQQMPALPVDFPGGSNTYGDSDHVTVSLNARETRKLLQHLPAAHGTQINDVLLAALVSAFAPWTGRRQLMIDMEGHGREDILPGLDVSRTLGWFTSQYPVWLDLEQAREPRVMLEAVKTQLRAIPHHGIGFGLLRHLCADREATAPLRALPAAPVNFNYLGQFDQFDPAAGEALPFAVAPESAGPEQHPEGRRSAVIYVIGIITGGELGVRFSYSRRLHQRRTIEQLAKNYLHELRRLLTV